MCASGAACCGMKIAASASSSIALRWESCSAIWRAASLKPIPRYNACSVIRAKSCAGCIFGDFTHPDDLAKDQELFQQLVAGKRDSYELELRYLGKDSSTGWVRLNVSLVRGVDGKPQFAIGMTEDITERQRAEQRLREAQKMEVVGRLVGGVAHDFNNLLTGITLYCDLLLAGLDKGSRSHHHAEEIRMAGEQGAALIQQLMAISRQQVVEPRILSLNDVIANTHNLLSRLLGEKFELVTRFDDQLGHVKMDPAQVQQILFNLVLNARDAMNEGGRILVETGNSELSQPANILDPSNPRRHARGHRHWLWNGLPRHSPIYLNPSSRPRQTGAVLGWGWRRSITSFETMAVPSRSTVHLVAERNFECVCLERPSRLRSKKSNRLTLPRRRPKPFFWWKTTWPCVRRLTGS